METYKQHLSLIQCCMLIFYLEFSLSVEPGALFNFILMPSNSTAEFCNEEQALALNKMGIANTLQFIGFLPALPASTLLLIMVQITPFHNELSNKSPYCIFTPPPLFKVKRLLNWKQYGSRVPHSSVFYLLPGSLVQFLFLNFTVVFCPDLQLAMRIEWEAVGEFFFPVNTTSPPTKIQLYCCSLSLKFNLFFIKKSEAWLKADINTPIIKTASTKIKSVISQVNILQKNKSLLTADFNSRVLHGWDGDDLENCVQSCEFG